MEEDLGEFALRETRRNEAERQRDVADELAEEQRMAEQSNTIADTKNTEAEITGFKPLWH